MEPLGSQGKCLQDMKQDIKTVQRPEELSMLLLCLAALLLRLWKIGDESLWQDEGFSVYISRFSIPFILQSLSYEFHPPLYYAILHFCLSFADSEAWIRGISVAAGVLTIPCIYYLGKELLSAKAGLISAFLLAFSPLHIEYCREARPYSLFCFLFTLSMLLFIRTMNTGRDRTIVLYCVATLAAVWTEFTGLFLLPIQAFVLLARKEKLERRWVSILAIITFLSAPVIWAFFARLLDLRTKLFWIPRQTPMQDIMQIMDAFMTGSGARSYWVALMLLPPIMWLIFSRFRLCRDVTIMWLLLPNLVFMLLSFWRPLFLVRQLLFTLPPFLLLMGGGMALLLQEKKKAAALLLLAALLIPAALGLGSLYGSLHKENWRALAAAVKEKGRAGDGMLFASEYPSYVFRYYYRNMHGTPAYRSLDHEADDRMLRCCLDGLERVWVVAYLKHDPDPAIVHAIDWLTSHWAEKSHQEFRGQELILFEKKRGAGLP
jgi:mannosyltransferase